MNEVLNQQQHQQQQPNNGDLSAASNLNEPIDQQPSHTVVHQHYTDKQGKSQENASGGNLQKAATANAAKVQVEQQESHKTKLKKLRERLHLLE